LCKGNTDAICNLM